ncbi:hypothetical protein PL8927_600214 [Planktothrix serta PCC 8927]|uniref:Uncharacterized protein n=1 Tax=Planktothrix serta PCC 8927 TaxID=671068 RepID=A0A7Z9BQ97_9CYAN|nr:hypothetical protein PL8927_600214 [Planktothrix serta PCC 8927]
MKLKGEKDRGSDINIPKGNPLSVLNIYDHLTLFNNFCVILYVIVLMVNQ